MRGDLLANSGNLNAFKAENPLQPKARCLVKMEGVKPLLLQFPRGMLNDERILTRCPNE